MIEKKRRDRINASLGELRRLVPAAARDPHSGKLEKAEILQLTVEHLRTLRNKGECWENLRQIINDTYPRNAPHSYPCYRQTPVDLYT